MAKKKSRLLDVIEQSREDLAVCMAMSSETHSARNELESLERIVIALGAEFDGKDRATRSRIFAYLDDRFLLNWEPDND